MQNIQKDNAVIKDIDNCIKSLEMSCVDVNEHKNSSQSYIFTVYLVKKDGSEVNTDDLSGAYNLIYPFLQMSRNCKNISLEVSSPGSERKIKDAYEFSHFKGKHIRVYDEKKDVWVYGTIESASDKALFLSGAFNDKEREISEDLSIDFENIKKANLLLELKR